MNSVDDENGARRNWRFNCRVSRDDGWRSVWNWNGAIGEQWSIV